MDLQKDFVRILDKFQKGKSIQIDFHRLHSPEEMFLYGCIRQIFSDHDLLHFFEPLNEAVREILRLAEKNSALPLFRNKLIEAGNQDVSEQEAYEILSKTPVTQLPESFTARLKLEHRTVVVDITFFSRIYNPTLDDESSHPIRNTDEYRLSLVLLQQIGLPPGNQQIFLEKKTIRIQTVVSLDALSQNIPGVDFAIESQLESLPAFPANVKKIMDLCESSTSSVQSIATAISEDQSMAAEVLRLANSGAFAGGGISSLIEAVKLLGVRTIASLLLKVGAFRIMEEKFGLTEELLTYPVEIGMIARELARNYRMNAQVDSAHTAGLLHHIGYVFLYAVKKEDDSMKIVDSDREDIARLILEERKWGISHATLGGQITRSWNLPEELTLAIEYHHRPRMSPGSGQDLASLVYLADAILENKRGSLNFYKLNPEILKQFQLNSPDAFQMLSTKIYSAVGS